MPLPNIYHKETTDEIIERIGALRPASKPNWGKMDVSQMLAHLNVTYEMVYDGNHKKPNFLMRLIMKTFIKKVVTNEVPYPHNSRTAPAFIISGTREFEKEKARLIAYIRKTQELGRGHFEGKESLSFGKLDSTEWNNMFYKHLDHHLRQFGF